MLLLETLYVEQIALFSLLLLKDEKFMAYYFWTHIKQQEPTIAKQWKADNFLMDLSEQLYKSGRIRPTLSTGQFSNLSKNQCYISRWTLWHIKFGAVTKTEALGVISSFRGWISLYRASRQNVLFFSRYAE